MSGEKKMSKVISDSHLNFFSTWRTILRSERAKVKDNVDAQSTNVEAMEKQRDLQCFLMSCKNTLDGDFEGLSKLEAAILKQTVSFRQFCISDLFHAVDK